MTVPDNNLVVLLNYYEEEKNRLLKLIDDCLRESEYLMAHYHSKALYQLNRRIQTFKNIEDMFYDEKSYKLSKINNLEKRLDAEIPDDMKTYLTGILLKEKQELEKLNQVPKNTISSETEMILDNALDNLVKKRVKGFKLILNKMDNFLLELSFTKNVFKITLPGVRRHISKYLLFDDNINSFKRLGFESTNNDNKLVLVLTYKRDDGIKELKLILSKIIFEIFYFKQFENESYIQYKEKTRR